MLVEIQWDWSTVLWTARCALAPLSSLHLDEHVAPALAVLEPLLPSMAELFCSQPHANCVLSVCRSVPSLAAVSHVIGLWLGEQNGEHISKQYLCLLEVMKTMCVVVISCWVVVVVYLDGSFFCQYLKTDLTPENLWTSRLKNKKKKSAGSTELLTLQAYS